MAMRLGALESVECIKIEGKAKYTFPYRTAIRFDFPARGGMPPMKLFWYDRLKAQPEIDGVPGGEPIGDKDINGSISTAAFSSATKAWSRPAATASARAWSRRRG